MPDTLVSEGVQVAIPDKLLKTKFVSGLCSILYSALPSSVMLNFIVTGTFTCASIKVSPEI